MSELIRVSHGLWRPPEAVADLGDLCAVILDAMPPGTVVAGRTAARLHRLWIPAASPARIELVLTRPGERPRAIAHSRRVEVHARRQELRARDVCILDGLPVTSEERTWVDLAEVLDLPDLVAAGDSVLRGTDALRDLDGAVRRASGRRGVRRAREALELLDARSRSRPESHTRVLLVLAGLPAPEVNVAVFNDHGEWLAEPDLHYRVPKVMIDYQGEEHADLGRMRKDISRSFDIVDEQWQQVLLGPAQVFGRPWTVAPMIRTLVERRAPGWLREWRESQRVAQDFAPLEAYRATRQRGA